MSIPAFTAARLACPIRAAFEAVEPVLAGLDGSISELVECGHPFDAAARVVVARGAVEAFRAGNLVFEPEAGLRACAEFLDMWACLLRDQPDCDDDGVAVIDGAVAAVALASCGMVVGAYSAGRRAAGEWRSGAAAAEWLGGPFPGAAALALAAIGDDQSVYPAAARAAFVSGFLSGFPGGRVYVDAVTGAVLG